MPRLPAFCPSCGAVYASPLRAEAPGGENAFDVPAPCPSCGGGGTVPGELLTRAAELAEWCAGPDGREEEMEALLELLEHPDRLPSGEEDALLLETARRAPSLVEVARRLPDGPPAVLRGIAALLRRVREMATPGADPASVATGAVERLLEEEAVERTGRDVPEEVARALDRLETAGRNDPCPCGSGDKYKACHWMEDLRVTRE